MPDEMTDWEYAIETNGGISDWGSTREEAAAKAAKWNERAVRLRAEARGQASYPSAFIVRRRPAVAAGPWERA